MRQLLAVALGVLALAQSGAAEGPAWVLVNPTGVEYSAELVRLKVELPANFAAGQWTVLEDGQEVPCQVEQINGKPYVWVATTLGKTGKHTYSLVKRAPAPSAKKVKAEREGAHFVLDNGLVGVRIPAQAGAAAPPPILEVRLPDQRWVGRGVFQCERKLKAFRAELAGDGTVYGKVRLEYEFEGTAGVQDVPAYYRVEISLPPERRHVVLEEAFELPRGSFWEFDAAQGWSPRQAITIPHFGGFDRQDMLDPEGKPFPWPPASLRHGQTRMGDTLLNLTPRWSQAYDDGWCFVAHDGAQAVGTLVCRASRWLWPHDSAIEVKVKPSADYAGFRCPVWRGKRYWFLLAGPRTEWAGVGECSNYAIRYPYDALDKLYHEYLLDWPGLQPPPAADGKPAPPAEEYGSIAGRIGRRSKPFFGWGPGAGSLGGEAHPLHTLVNAQLYYDPDTFGNYWLHWSPENPNFATSWWQPLYWQTGKLKDHPRFKDLAKLAELRFHEDMYHSVTLPGGAGQECPGYFAGVTGMWRRLAPFCKEQMGFDPTLWPQWKAAGSYFLHISYPLGDGRRRCHPAGDTHPPGPDVFEVASAHGVEENIAAFGTDELPGFGVVFRNHPETPRETYLAFKSGPNRGHFHGDELSFHYCAYARPLAVDHHCSYGPRAGQEHMHNRVAFHTPQLPYANMDGYERVIAFKPSAEVDIAVGQVESERLRVTKEFPPERWDTYLPEEVFQTPLKYRRTIVFMKGGERDYFVIRDQHEGPEVSATYCLHAYGEKCEQKGNTFEFDGFNVFIAKPGQYEVSRHDWQHSNGGLEVTKGLRLTTRGRSGEFITVLMPRRVKTVEALQVTLPGALLREERPGRDASKVPPAVPKDLDLFIARENGRLLPDQAVFRALAYSLGAHSGAVALTETAASWKLEVQVKAAGDRSAKDGKGEYVIALKREGEGASGTFKGTFGGKEVAGQARAIFVKDALPVRVDYEDAPPPEMSAIPGGVRVAQDEIVFAGGIAEQGDATYVTVRRAGKELLTLTGKDIDLDRSQGQIGLFVPDAGYPFGVIPDWLIKQRAKRPDWYTDLWPLTEHTTMGRP